MSSTSCTPHVGRPAPHQDWDATWCTVVTETPVPERLRLTGTYSSPPTGAPAPYGPAEIILAALPWFRAAALLGGTDEDSDLVSAYVRSRRPRVKPKPLTRKAQV